MLLDWRTAPVDARLRAALGFLEKLTLTPESLERSDLNPLRAVGVSDAGIRNLIYTCFLFSIMDRLADALDFELPNSEGRHWRIRIANWIGYRFSLFG